jgi:DNA-binding NtrC family response regulator
LEQPAPGSIVLVVEDEILIRTAIAGYLRECGYEVIEAVSADEAIVVLAAETVRIDIVFSDVEMPGSMNGFGLAKWLREHRPRLPVILAGNVDKAPEAAADLCEYGPMLSKPYEPQALVDHIKRLLSGMASRNSLDQR